jgi:bisphosphoglycerate-dependent phosphoglycerate mutase family 1
MMNHRRLVVTLCQDAFRCRVGATIAVAQNNGGASQVSHLKTNDLRQRCFIAKRTIMSLNQGTPYNICFLRHGQSTWNRDNRFIGWTDTPLTDQGVLEARVAGQMLHTSNIQFDEVHTSLLRRSIRTTNIVLMEMAQEYIPVYKHWRLNERNYGALTGLNKKECVAQHGVEQVKRWRRSYDIPPPPMEDDHPYHPKNDPRYRNVRDFAVLVHLQVASIRRPICRRIQHFAELH